MLRDAQVPWRSDMLTNLLCNARSGPISEHWSHTLVSKGVLRWEVQVLTHRADNVHRDQHVETKSQRFVSDCPQG